MAWTRAENHSASTPSQLGLVLTAQFGETGHAWRWLEAVGPQSKVGMVGCSSTTAFGWDRSTHERPSAVPHARRPHLALQAAWTVR
jgi:hypothetical protein